MEKASHKAAMQQLEDQLVSLSQRLLQREAECASLREETASSLLASRQQTERLEASVSNLQQVHLAAALLGARVAFKCQSCKTWCFCWLSLSILWLRKPFLRA